MNSPPPSASPLSWKERGIEGVSFWVKFPGACPGIWVHYSALGFIPFDHPVTGEK